MPFITAGDPDVVTTQAVIRELGSQGVDLIEVGFPYSDPIADGPVIQASYTRALRKGIRIDAIFDAIEELPTDDLPPLVAMVSFALVFRRGVQAFVQRAVEVGFTGFIIPDLPADEAGETAEIVTAAGADLIQLISPTTPAERAIKIVQSGSGFVYCISVAGTTGVRDELPAALIEQLSWLRKQTDLPLAVGFGISRPDQVDVLRPVADGVIVGSAIVRQLENADSSLAVKNIGEFAQTLVVATRAK